LLFKKQLLNTDTYFDTLFCEYWNEIKPIVTLHLLVMHTLEEVKVPMDEEESFLSQVWEKVCSPDYSSLVSIF